MARVFRWHIISPLIAVGCLAMPAWGKTPPATEFPSLSLAHTPAIAWVVKVKKRSGMGRGLFQFATPAIHGDFLYVGTAGGRVYGIDRQRGERRWSFETEGSVIGAVRVADDQLFVGDSKGILYALGAGDGQPHWRIELGSELAAAPLATTEMVCVVTSHGELVALDRATGARKWRTNRRTTAAPFAVRGSAGPILVDHRVVVGYPDGTLVAHDLLTGAVVWETRLALPAAVLQDVDATPAMTGAVIVAAAVEGALAALDVRTGVIRWRTEVGTPNAIAVDGGTIYVATAGRVQAIDAGNGVGRWKTRLPAEETSGPAVIGEKLVVVSTSDQVYILARADGAVIGKRHLGTGSYGELAVAGEHVYLLTNAGSVVALRIP